MRTTITLDDKIAHGLKKLQKKNPHKSFKEIVNQLLEKGLAVSGDSINEDFTIKPLPAVPRRHLNFDNISKLLETAEGDFHK
ncbi:hypothetical protein BH24ACI2_BH24ACI2_09350 [soil metagenome]|jgi:hypothetical protein|nr:hypothetical protein [Acidobacteriota bacterium]